MESVFIKTEKLIASTPKVFGLIAILLSHSLRVLNTKLIITKKLIAWVLIYLLGINKKTINSKLTGAWVFGEIGIINDDNIQWYLNQLT